MKKVITINEKAVYDLLYPQLSKSYDLNYVSYDDAISPQTLEDILRHGLQDQFIDIFSDQEDYYARLELDRLIDTEAGLDRDEKTLFRETSEYDDLLMEIKQRNDTTACKDLIRNSRIRCRVTLHSNYDCWLPLWEARGLYGKEDALEGLMKMLSLNPAKVKAEAVRQGIDCYRCFPNLKYREGKELVSYEGFVECLSECPNYGLWTFFGIFDMQALWDSDFQTQGLVIPAGTKCTMFNSWNGGGSLAFTETLRPVTLEELSRRGGKYDGPKVYVDERLNEYGYSSGEVYGCTLSEKEILTSGPGFTMNTDVKKAAVAA